MNTYIYIYTYTHIVCYTHIYIGIGIGIYTALRIYSPPSRQILLAFLFYTFVLATIDSLCTAYSEHEFCIFSRFTSVPQCPGFSIDSISKPYYTHGYLLNSQALFAPAAKTPRTSGAPTTPVARTLPMTPGASMGPGALMTPGTPGTRLPMTPGDAPAPGAPGATRTPGAPTTPGAPRTPGARAPCTPAAPCTPCGQLVPVAPGAPVPSTPPGASDKVRAPGKRICVSLDRKKAVVECPSTSLLYRQDA